MPKDVAIKTARFEDLLDDVLSRLRMLSEEAGEKSEAALHAAAKDLANSARALGEHAKDSAKAVGKAAAKGAKEHPVATAAIAATAVASAAAVVALLLHQRKA